jgi:hypothetical protein
MKTPNFITQNAFNIVGLPTTSPISEAKNRSSHLISLSKIDETETFDSDVGQVQNLRKETNLRRALERLTSVKDRLGETFFWYEMDTATDVSLFQQVTKGQYEEAANGWEDSFNQTKNWIAKKNLALTLCLLSFKKGSLDDFRKCIYVWREIWKSDEFWTFYTYHYGMHDDLGTAKTLFQDFRNSLGEHLSRFTAEAYHQIGTSAVIGVLYATFDVVGKDIEDNIITPLSKKLMSALDELEAKASSETFQITKSDFTRCLEEVTKCIESVRHLGLDGYSPLQVLIQKAAEKLHSISIDLHNNQNDLKRSRELLELGMSLNASHSFQAQANKDRVQLRKNEIFAEEIMPKLEEIKDQPAEKRYQRLIQIQENVPKDVEFDDLIAIRRRFVVEYAVEMLVKGKEELLEHKNENYAQDLFSKANELLMKHFDDFNLNKEKILEIASDLSKEALTVRNPEYLSQIDTRLAEIRQTGESIKVDDWSKLAFVFLCQSVLYRDIAPYLKRIRYGNYLVTIGNFTWFFYGIGVIFWIAGFLYKRKVI